MGTVLETHGTKAVLLTQHHGMEQTNMYLWLLNWFRTGALHVPVPLNPLDVVRHGSTADQTQATTKTKTKTKKCFTLLDTRIEQLKPSQVPS